MFYYPAFDLKKTNWSTSTAEIFLRLVGRYKSLRVGYLSNIQRLFLFQFTCRFDYWFQVELWFLQDSLTCNIEKLVPLPGIRIWSLRKWRDILSRNVSWNKRLHRWSAPFCFGREWFWDFKRHLFSALAQQTMRLRKGFLRSKPRILEIQLLS